ncbi:MAG: transcription elongation factor GreA [Veillonellaceae bacterium]|nr:transcription elongation factor GreA [Veillonellaceae bacterium]MDD6922941.1 transcription elongation factor GreA [Veillonellaceae bacterium]
MAANRVMLTEDGYKKLVEKLNYLKSVKRIEIAERLKAAIALGDLSENSEYDDAKNEQAFLEGEIAELEQKIRNSDIIKNDGTNKDIVQMGNTVVIKDLEFGDEDTFTIVGSTEADPDENKISNESPVGAAIIGQQVGSTVEVNAPAGVLKYQIVEIK